MQAEIHLHIIHGFKKRDRSARQSNEFRMAELLPGNPFDPFVSPYINGDKKGVAGYPLLQRVNITDQRRFFAIQR